METVTLLKIDKSEFSESFYQVIREELQKILLELNSKETDDAVLNWKETCKLLSITQATLQKYQNEGRIPQ
jgi:hypothetical protein